MWTLLVGEQGELAGKEEQEDQEEGGNQETWATFEVPLLSDFTCGLQFQSTSAALRMGLHLLN